MRERARETERETERERERYIRERESDRDRQWEIEIGREFWFRLRLSVLAYICYPSVCVAEKCVRVGESHLCITIFAHASASAILCPDFDSPLWQVWICHDCIPRPDSNVQNQDDKDKCQNRYQPSTNYSLWPEMSVADLQFGRRNENGWVCHTLSREWKDLKVCWKLLIVDLRLLITKSISATQPALLSSKSWTGFVKYCICVLDSNGFSTNCSAAAPIQDCLPLGLTILFALDFLASACSFASLSFCFFSFC